MLSRGLDIVDMLFGDTESLVLVGDRLLRLGPIGTELLWCCEDPISIEQANATIVEIFGEPPTGDATELLSRAVDELTELGVLVRTVG